MNRLLPHFRLWHLAIGLGAGLFLIGIALTGLLLQYAPQLGLDRLTVRHSILLRPYMPESPRPRHGFLASHTWVVQRDADVYVGRSRIALDGPLVAALRWQDGMLLASASQLRVLDRDGQTIETVPAPAVVEGLGLGLSGRLYLRSSDGIRAADARLLDFQPTVPTEAIRWATPQPLPTAVAERLETSQLRASITIERLLLDLHSGRWFGPAGPLVVSGVAVAIPFLAGSGFTLWWVRRSRRATRPRTMSR